MPFKYPFTVFKGSFFAAFLKQMYTVSDFCKDPSPTSCDEELVAKAFQMALARRRPQAGLLHHSDRGCQYTSHAYRQRLEQAGVVVSMSRKGNCWDNAVMESFFGSRDAKSVWVTPSIHLMSKPGSHSLSIWRCTTIARGATQRWDT